MPSSHSDHIGLDPEAVPLLLSLRRHVKLALITNFDHPPEIDVLLETHDLSRHFDLVLISGRVGVNKPDPAIFSLALNALDLRPHEVAHVGDSEDDVSGAQTAGCLPVRIPRIPDGREDGVLTVSRLSESPFRLRLPTSRELTT